MESKIAQLSKDLHAKVKLKLNNNFDHVASHHITPVIVHEIGNAAADLPVAFVKNSETNDYICVALLGLKDGENLLVENGRWMGAFIPAGYTHYPLSIVPHPDDQSRYSLTIDMASETISEDDGEALFNEDGSESEYLQKRRKALENYYQCAIATREFIRTLAELDLLTEQGFSFEVEGDKRNVTGIHIVDEAKFNQLADEVILDLRKKGYLGAIYAHMMSLKQTQRLVNRIPAREENASA